MNAVRIGAEAPTKPLYVELPGDVVLQMCVMRPEPDDVCPPLPFFAPPPPHPSCLASAGLRPHVLSPADVLGAGAFSASAALPTDGDDGNAAAIDHPGTSDGCAFSAAERSAVLLAAEEAAVRGCRPSAELSRLRADDWLAAEHTSGSLFAALDASQLRLLAEAARSQALCDLLLRRALPRLLSSSNDDKAEEEQRHAHDGQAAAARDDNEGRGGNDVETNGSSAAPLPSALSELLLGLLRGGSLLRLSAAEFDAQVVHQLHGVGTQLGARAAAQAALAFAVLHREKWVRPEGRSQEVRVTVI